MIKKGCFFLFNHQYFGYKHQLLWLDLVTVLYSGIRTGLWMFVLQFLSVLESLHA